MAIKIITDKIITKFDTQNPNFKLLEPEVEEVDGNIVKDDIYNEIS